MNAIPLSQTDTELVANNVPTVLLLQRYAHDRSGPILEVWPFSEEFGVRSTIEVARMVPRFLTIGDLVNTPHQQLLAFLEIMKIMIAIPTPHLFHFLQCGLAYPGVSLTEVFVK